MFSCGRGTPVRLHWENIGDRNAQPYDYSSGYDYGKDTLVIIRGTVSPELWSREQVAGFSPNNNFFHVIRNASRLGTASQTSYGEITSLDGSEICVR